MFSILCRNGKFIKTHSRKDAVKLLKEDPLRELRFQLADGTVCAVCFDPALNRFIFDAPDFMPNE